MAQNNIDLILKESDLKTPEAMSSCINGWLTSDIMRRFDRSQAWSEAIHFLAGNQWIRYSTFQHRFEMIPTTDNNRAIERPVTNYFLKWILTNVSGLSNIPNLICEAVTDEPEDKTSAQISDVVLDYLWEEHNKSDQYYEANMWGTACGPVFRKSVKVPTGKYYNDVPLYEVKPEIVPPFHLIFDGVPSRFEDIGVIMQASVMRVSEVKRLFGCDQPGYYPENAAKVEAEDIKSIPISLFEGLKNIVPGESTSPFSETAGGSYLESCIVKEVYVAPSEKHPKGLMIIVAGNQTVFAGDSPYFYLEGKIWHPYTMWSWAKLPGNVWGLGLGPQLTKIQRRINSIDAIISYNRKTMAVPMIWSPNGCGVAAGTFVGMPGQVVTYNESPNGQRPVRDQGIPLPPSVMQEREQLLVDGSAVAMSADLRSGQNPSGVNTVGQLQILTEQAEMSKSKQTESWERFIAQSEYLDLLNFRDCNLEVVDPSTVQKLKRFSKEMTKFDWSQFRGTQIQENVTIRIEKGSTVQRSRLAKQQVIMDLAIKGLLPEIMQGGSYERKKFLEEFGLTSIYSDANVDEQFCEKAIEMMLEDQYPPVIKGIHNPDVQLPVLMRFMKNQKYLELDPKIQKLFMKRQEELTALLSEAISRQNEIGAQSQPTATGQQPQ